MCELADSGIAILMISSDMEELLGMSDRIIVLCEGRLAGEVKQGRLQPGPHPGPRIRDSLGDTAMKSQTVTVPTTGASIGARMRKYAPQMILVGLVILFSIISPNFMTPYNLVILVRQVSFVAISAVGLMFVMIGGAIDLSIGSQIILTNIVLAIMMAYARRPHAGRDPDHPGAGHGARRVQRVPVEQAEGPPAHRHPGHGVDLQGRGLHHRQLPQHHGLPRRVPVLRPGIRRPAPGADYRHDRRGADRPTSSWSRRTSAGTHLPWAATTKRPGWPASTPTG